MLLFRGGEFVYFFCCQIDFTRNVKRTLWSCWLGSQDTFIFVRACALPPSRQACGPSIGFPPLFRNSSHALNSGSCVSILSAPQHEKPLHEDLLSCFGFGPLWFTMLANLSDTKTLLLQLNVALVCRGIQGTCRAPAVLWPPHTECLQMSGELEAVSSRAVGTGLHV